MARETKNNIDKAMEALTGALEIEPTGEEVQLEPEKNVKFDPEVELMENEDGSADVNFDPNSPIDTSNIPHDANLADYIEDNDLSRLSSDLLAGFESDKDSRKDWEESYVKGLDMLGFKYEDRTQPFEGASGSFTPYSLNLLHSFKPKRIRNFSPQAAPFVPKL